MAAVRRLEFSKFLELFSPDALFHTPLRSTPPLEGRCRNIAVKFDITKSKVSATC